MILAETTIDFFLAGLIQEYLALPHADWMALKGLTPTTQTAALDIPAGFSIKAADMGGVPARPGVIIAAKEEAGNTSARRQLTISCILCTWLKSSAEGAANVGEQTTRAEASMIQIAMENRLRDSAALSAWLASLDVSILTGWNIISPLVVSSAPPSRNANLHTVDYATVIRLTVAVARYSPA